MQIHYDPFDPLIRDDPFEAYARLREHAPVYRAEGANAWVISRYEDVRHVLRSPELFSSDAMANALLGIPPGVNPVSDPESLKRMAEFAKSIPFEIQPGRRPRNLITTDPPEHDQMRTLVNRGFTPRRTAPYEKRVREIAAAAVDRLRGGEGFDLVRDLAIPVPVVVIAEMIGVETERLDDFKRWSDDLIAATTGSRRELGMAGSGLPRVMGELSRYIAEIAERRLREPKDDLVTVLMQSEGGEAGLSPFELCMFVMLLLVAGNETTTNLIGNAVNALLDHPDELARVAAEPRLVEGWVEETLRWDSPIQLVFRRTTREVEVAGTAIPANQYVVPLIGSANRDEAFFPGGEAFDVTRNAQGHLAFGLGVHFCLGASLARLEARVALEALLPELPGLRKLEARPELVDSFLIRGRRRLPLARA